jgi:hypothetical protein
LLVALALPATAQEDLPNLRFSGFGTLGLAQTSTRAVGFYRDNTQPAVAAAVDKPSGDIDTRIGLQLSSRLSESLLATLQVMSKCNYDHTYKPGISYATLAWWPVEDVQLRVGAMSLEVLPDGDYSHVGYAFLWVRPPVEVFGPLGASRIKGVDLANTWHFGGGTTLQASLFGGVADEKVPATGLGAWDWTGGRTLGASAWLHSGDLRLRGAYSTSRIPRNLPGSYADFEQGFRTLSALLQDPRLNQVADQLDFTGRHVHSLELGAAWESGPWQAQGMYSHKSTDSLLAPTTQSGFLSLGYRVGPVVPYVVYARAVSKRPARPDVGDLGNLPAAYGPLAAAGAAAVQGLDIMLAANAVDQYTWSGGLRWDFRENFDLKVQVDQIRAHNSVGLQAVFDAYAPRTWDGRMTVVSVAVDFIFGVGR